MTLALDIFLKEQMFAVVNGVGELRNPVAENQHPCTTFLAAFLDACLAILAQHQVEFDVAMAIDEKVDIFMGFEVFFRIYNKVFAVFTVEWSRTARCLVRPIAIACPTEAETHSPPRMQEVQKPLAHAVVEQPTKELELAARVTQSVAVSEVENVAVDVGRQRLAMDNHSTFLLEIAVGPKVVVAREEMHLHTHVGQFRDFSQKPRIAFRHHVSIFVPKVENIAHQIDGGSLRLDAVEKPHQSALLHSRMRNGKRAQMGIG